MRLLYKSVNMETIGAYMDYWSKTPQKSSDYSPGVLLCWERAMKYEIAFEEEEELAWIRGSYPRQMIGPDEPADHYLAPIGRWDHDDWDEIIGARFGDAVQFQLVPEGLAEIWKSQMGGAVELEEHRESWEYLHYVEDLAELSGGDYVKKRNRINQFVKQNPYEYIPITKELIPRIVEFQKEWADSYRAFNSTGSIERESDGIIRNILGNWDGLPQMLGGAIEVLGTQIVAYTVAEAVDDQVMIHFEKASLEYPAAYQVINREFLIHQGSAFKIVNREEDMGDPGLRDAKMSYNPYAFLKKYTVDIRL